jgi:glutathione S-transferase
MPINPDASIEVTAFKWVPPFAEGLVRDLRVRWALEELGLDYRVRLVGRPLPDGYVYEQPFEQVPCFSDGTVKIFESGAIVQYLGEKSETLLPTDAQSRYRAIQWSYAALNSVEPAILNVFAVTVFYADEEWAKLRRQGAEEFARVKLKRVSDWLGDKQWLEGDRFTIGDLMMITVLRALKHTGMVGEFANLDAYVKHGEARPAFKQALADQIAPFRENQPEGVAA